MAQKYNEEETVKKVDYSILKRAFSYLKPYPTHFIFLFLLGTVSTVCFLYFTKILGNALDILLNSFSSSFLVSTCLLLLVILLVGCACKFFRGKILIQLKNNISIQIRNDLLNKLVVLPQNYYDNIPHGKIYARVSYYVDHITYVLCEVLLDLLLQIITFFLLFLFLLSIHVSLTILTLFLVLLFFMLYIYLTPKWFLIRKKYQNQESNIQAYLSETLKGVKITQAFLREEKNVSIYDSLLQESYQKSIPNRYIGNLSWSLGHVFEMLTTILVYVCGFAFYYPSLSIGSIIIFGTYTNSFWHPITQITNLYDAIIQAFDYLGRIYDLLDYQEEATGLLPCVITKGEIRLDHISFSYVPNQKVLHDLSFTIPGGKKIAIVGATGSGKSTIIQLITRLYEPSRGSIFIDGVDHRQMNLKSLRNEIMTMNQDGFLFSKSIYENLVLARTDISKEQVFKVCQKIHIDDFILSLPNGYDTIVSGNGSEFSTGQKQMLCIARILIQDPKIAILDEATSNVDVLTEQVVVDTFFEVFSHKTTIVIAHRLSTIIHSDIIFVMDHGDLKEFGTHEELLKQKGKYFQIYQSQTNI